MKIFQKALLSKKLLLVYWILVFIITIIIGFWQFDTIMRKIEEVTTDCDDYFYSWYNLFNFKLKVINDLFEFDEDTSEKEQGILIDKRLNYWKSRTIEPRLVGDVYSVRRLKNKKIEVKLLEGDTFKTFDDLIWEKRVESLYKKRKADTLMDRSFSLTFEEGVLCLFVETQFSDIDYVIEIDRDLFFTVNLPYLSKYISKNYMNESKAFRIQVFRYKDGKKVEELFKPIGPDEVLSSIIPLTTVTYISPEDIEESPKGKSIGRLKLNMNYQLYNWFFVNKNYFDGPYQPFDSFDFWIPYIKENKEILFLGIIINEDIAVSEILANVIVVLIFIYSFIFAIGIALYALSRYSRESYDLLVMQEEFVSSLTHELRTPLHVITTGADNLASGIIHKEDNIIRYGKMMKKEGLRLGTMIESILSYSGVSHRQLEREFIDLNRFLEDEILPPYKTICQQEGIDFIIQIDEVPNYIGNRAGLRLIISNLLSNAIKYGGHGKWLKLCISSTKNLNISIEDHGLGMSSKELNRIKEPFFRGERALKSNIKSTGLGLSIVDRVVRQEGGSFNIFSREGVGSHFLISLPNKYS